MRYNGAEKEIHVASFHGNGWLVYFFSSDYSILVCPLYYLAPNLFGDFRNSRECNWVAPDMKGKGNEMQAPILRRFCQ